MDEPLYTRAEVSFLLSITLAEARALVVEHPGLLDSRAKDLAIHARWHDVHDALRRVLRRRPDRVLEGVITLRATGFSDQEIGTQLQVSQATVSRRFSAHVRAVLVELGGERVDTDDRVSIVSACLTCGAAPRATIPAVRRRVRGGWKTVTPERQSGNCQACLGANLAAA